MRVRLDETARSERRVAAIDSDSDLIAMVLWDRGSAVSLMEHLSRYRSFLVEPDRRRWLVFARCDKVHSRTELLEQVDSWASAHDRVGPEVDDRPASVLFDR